MWDMSKLLKALFNQLSGPYRKAKKHINLLKIFGDFQERKGEEGRERAPPMQYRLRLILLRFILSPSIMKNDQ